MDSDDSYVIIGGRRRLPQVYIATESETENCSLRHRSSGSGSSTTGSLTPPSGSSTPHQRAAGPGQYSSTPYSSKKEEQAIPIDSGYLDLHESVTSPASLSSSLLDSLIISPAKNLQKKLRGKPSFVEPGLPAWRCRPQQVLTGIVSALIAVCFLLIVFIGVSSNSGEREFNNGKYESIKAGAAGSEAETAVPPGLEQGFLLPEDVTEEEVLRLARLQQAGQQAGQVQPEDAVALQRIGAAVVQNLLKEPVVQDLQKPLSKMKEAKVAAVKAEIENKNRKFDTDNKLSVVKKNDQPLALYTSSLSPAVIDKDAKPLKSSKKTKHVNPLMKSLPRAKTSKAKSKAGVKTIPISTVTASTDSTSEDDVDFPDDPDYSQIRSVADPADPDNDPDYPDDPKFRSSAEETQADEDNDPDYPDDPKFRSSAEETQADERIKRTAAAEELTDNKFRKSREETPDSPNNGDFYLRRKNEGDEGFRRTSSDDDGRSD